MKTPAASTRITQYALAIDTSAGTTVAVLSMGSVIAEVNYLEPMTHSERIGSAIEKVLQAHSLVFEWALLQPDTLRLEHRQN
jgi:hypothetical protein